MQDLPTETLRRVGELKLRSSLGDLDAKEELEQCLAEITHNSEANPSARLSKPAKPITVSRPKSPSVRPLPKAQSTLALPSTYPDRHLEDDVAGSPKSGPYSLRQDLTEALRENARLSYVVKEKEENIKGLEADRDIAQFQLSLCEADLLTLKRQMAARAMADGELSSAHTKIQALEKLLVAYKTEISELKQTMGIAGQTKADVLRSEIFAMREERERLVKEGAQLREQLGSSEANAKKRIAALETELNKTRLTYRSEASSSANALRGKIRSLQDQVLALEAKLAGESDKCLSMHREIKRLSAARRRIDSAAPAPQSYLSNGNHQPVVFDSPRVFDRSFDSASPREFSFESAHAGMGQAGPRVHEAPRGFAPDPHDID